MLSAGSRAGTPGQAGTEDGDAPSLGSLQLGGTAGRQRGAGGEGGRGGEREEGREREEERCTFVQSYLK